MIKRSVIASIFLAWVCLCAAPARGDTLADIAQKAVLKNPEVLARWHNFRAASKEIDVARGLYLPSVDLSAGGGRERNQSVFDTTTLNRNNVTLTLSQMLYDGSAVRNEVGRLTNSQLTRYYELLDASENAALEAARAYHDVLRHRRLFALTEDNYVTHRTVFEQIQQKVQAGVGRRVDLEQAAVGGEEHLLRSRRAVFDDLYGIAIWILPNLASLRVPPERDLQTFDLDLADDLALGDAAQNKAVRDASCSHEFP